MKNLQPSRAAGVEYAAHLPHPMNPAEHQPRLEDAFLSRREFLLRSGMGMGALSLAGLLGAEFGGTAHGELIGGSTNPLLPKQPHFPAKAKHVIHIFAEGAPSHVDTWDPKPALCSSTPDNRSPACAARPFRRPSSSLSMGSPALR